MRVSPQKRLVIEGRQPVSRPRLVALLISWLDLVTRRGPRWIDEASDLLADFTLQGAAARCRSIGAGHAREVRINLLEAGVGQSPLPCFGPVERNAEKGAARTTLLTDIRRHPYFAANGQRPVIGPKASLPGITVTTR
jgi:hypothetical protein